MMIKDDPYTNDTSKLLRERYSSINTDSTIHKKECPKQWSDVSVKGVSGRFI